MNNDQFNLVPSWDGRQDTWENYQDEVRIWVLGSPPGPEYSLAARLVSRLKGPARRIGLKMTDDELMPTPPVYTDGKVTTPANHTQAVKLLMERLGTLAPAKTQRRGTYLKEFFQEQRTKRRPGERIAEWIPRWEEGVTRMEKDGIDFRSMADLPGFFFLEHVNLSESRLELVRSAVPAEKLYDLVELKSTIARLFPQVHLTEYRRQGKREGSATTAPPALQ